MNLIRIMLAEGMGAPSLIINGVKGQGSVTPYYFMKIKVNGEYLETSETTLIGLLCSLGIKKDAVAVELNLNVIKKKNYETTNLKDGDRVEIVNFVGGG